MGVSGILFELGYAAARAGARSNPPSSYYVSHTLFRNGPDSFLTFRYPPIEPKDPQTIMSSFARM